MNAVRTAVRTARHDATHQDPAVALTSAASYDLLLGTLSLTTVAGAASSASVRAADWYEIVGPPAGTVVTLIAQFVVDGRAGAICGPKGCNSLFGARMVNARNVVERAVQAPVEGHADLRETLALPVTLVVGQSQEIRFELFSAAYSGSRHEETGTGWIRFTGLPPGTSVRSCQGYAGQAVPTTPTTWGEVKARYH